MFVKVSMSPGIDLASVEKLRHGKTGNKKQATCLATLLQKELNSDVARFTTHIKPVLQQIRLLTGLNVVGKTRNTAFQLVLPQCCKTSCTFSFRLRAASLFSVVRRAKRETRKWPRASALLSRVSRLRRFRARVLLSLNLKKKRDCSQSSFRCPFYRSFRWHCRPNNSLSSE